MRAPWLDLPSSSASPYLLRVGVRVGVGVGVRVGVRVRSRVRVRVSSASPYFAISPRARTSAEAALVRSSGRQARMWPRSIWLSLTERWGTPICDAISA
eukprot:scaffold478_cov48-Phaeocystis_antarctica.AAC.2